MIREQNSLEWKQMKRRKWDAEIKTKIVLEGLSGKPVAQLCTEYSLSQGQYYQWREVFLANATKAFETGNVDAAKHSDMRILKLQAKIGELTMALKKSEEW
jgi:transposase-like protein